MLRQTFILAAVLGTLALNPGSASACGTSSAELLQSGVRPEATRCGMDYNKAMALAYDKDWTGAITAIKVQIADKHIPPNPDLFELLGYLQHNAGDDAGSIENYQKAIALEPERFSAHRQLTLLYVSMGELAKAEDHLATLKTVCDSRCGELDELKAAIAESGAIVTPAPQLPVEVPVAVPLAAGTGSVATGQAKPSVTPRCGAAANIPALAAGIDELLPTAQLSEADLTRVTAMRESIQELSVIGKEAEARDIEQTAMSLLGYQKIWLHCGFGTFTWIKQATTMEAGQTR
jgi:hypothetical protein